MDKLDYDRTAKLKLKDAICEYLYEPMRRAFKERLDSLIVRNTTLGGYDHKHFVYKGVVYNGEASAPPIRKNRLAASLRAEMDEYLAEQAEVNQKEIPFVVGFINQTLNSSDNITDYLQVLPDAVHYPVEQLAATCPCRTSTLASDKAQELRDANQLASSMMKKRLVRNLLL